MIVSDQVLEHVSSLNDSLIEISRVARINGYIYIEYPNYNGSYEPHYRMDFKKDLKRYKDEFKKEIIQKGYNVRNLEKLNFIGPEDIIEVYKNIGGMQVFDYSTTYRIKILCRKISDMGKLE